NSDGLPYKDSLLGRDVSPTAGNVGLIESWLSVTPHPQYDQQYDNHAPHDRPRDSQLAVSHITYRGGRALIASAISAGPMRIAPAIRKPSLRSTNERATATMPKNATVEMQVFSTRPFYRA